jgi:hypothetical protein
MEFHKERRCTTRGGFENGETPAKIDIYPAKSIRNCLPFPHRKPLMATSHPQANNRHQHVHGVANQVNFASRDIKPIDGKLNDPGPGLGERDEKFDIEGEALLVQTILDGFIASAAHKFETALRIVDGDAGCQTYECGKETASEMAEPGSLDRAAKDLAARTEQGIRSAFAVQDSQQSDDLVRRDRAVGIE